MSKVELDDQTIYIYIQTYELGKDYLIRALDSIKNQTYTNFRCLVYDNCSGDEVRKKLKEYVDKDERFSLTCFDNTEGHTIAWEYGIPEILHLAGNRGGYYCRLDADDELEMDCFEKMQAYLVKNNLDMVASASRFVDADTLRILAIRGTKDSFVLEGDLFDKRLPEYHQIMRTHWGKLYHLDVIKRMNLSNLKVTTYGGDTLFVREALLKAKRVGILSEPLYIYYVYSQVRNYNYEKGRINSPRLLLERDFSFLLQKCGSMSCDTIAWLINVYLLENMDVFRLIEDDSSGDQQKIEDVYTVLSSIPCRLAMRLGANCKYGYLVNWLLNLNILESPQTINMVAEIFGILGIIPDGIPNCGNADCFCFFMKMYDFWDDYDSKNVLEKRIMICVKNSLLLQNVSFYYCRFNKDIVDDLLRENYEDAYAKIKEIVQKVNYFNGQFMEENIEIGQNIAAILDNQTEYIFMSKKRIELLINCDMEEAWHEVNEWIELLPQDKELLELRRIIDEKKGAE